jgi:hypothetical protein
MKILFLSLALSSASIILSGCRGPVSDLKQFIPSIKDSQENLEKGDTAGMSRSDCTILKQVVGRNEDVSPILYVYFTGKVVFHRGIDDPHVDMNQLKFWAKLAGVDPWSIHSGATVPLTKIALYQNLDIDGNWGPDYGFEDP